MKLVQQSTGYKIEGTNIVLKKRHDSKFWQVWIWHSEDRKYKCYSSKTEDLNAAAVLGIEKQHELKIMKKLGFEIFDTPILKCSNDWLDWIKSRQVQGYKSPHMIVAMETIVRRHIIPQLGTIGIGKFSQADMEQYVGYMITNNLRSRTSFHHHRLALTGIQKFAIEHGSRQTKGVIRLEVPEYKVAVEVSRSRFSNQEVSSIISSIDSYVDGYKERFKRASKQAVYNAKLLRIMIYFMLGTGCRTNDLNLVTWKDFQMLSDGTGRSGCNAGRGVGLFKYLYWDIYHSEEVNHGVPLDDPELWDEDGYPPTFDHSIEQVLTGQFLKVYLQGKKHPRYVPVEASLIRRLTIWFGEDAIHKTDSDLVFAGFNGKFNDNYPRWFKDYLEFVGIKDDNGDGIRVPYSLRHTFITDKLIEGKNPFDLALQCGTDVRHIQKTYCHMLPEDLYRKIFG